MARHPFLIAALLAFAGCNDLCASGRVIFITDMMNCLMMDACQSAVDPSGATACVAGVVAPARVARPIPSTRAPS